MNQKTCPTCGQAIPQPAGRLICSVCGEPIRHREGGWTHGGDGRPRHRMDCSSAAPVADPHQNHPLLVAEEA